MAASDTVEAEGHLIDSGLLSGIFDKIIEVRGPTRSSTSTSGAPTTTRRASRCASPRRDAPALADLLQQLTTFGCHAVKEQDAVVKPAEKDRCVPDDFYSTTNHRTHVRVGGRWVEVERQRMDAVIVVGGRPRRVPQAARREGRRIDRVRPSTASASRPSSGSATVSASRS